MSEICQITGKRAMVGSNVPHLKRRTKRGFNVNLFTKKFYQVEQDCWVSLNTSAAGLRIINKLGLDAAVRMAAEKGYLNAQLVEDMENDKKSKRKQDMGNPWVYRVREKWNAGYVSLYHYEGQKEYYSEIGVDEIQPGFEEDDVTQRN